MAEEHVGTITHYFAKPEVGVVKLTAEIRIGDVLRIRGHTTEIEQEITSLEVDHGAVESAAAGTEVAFKVSDRVRKGDDVYKITPD